MKILVKVTGKLISLHDDRIVTVFTVIEGIDELEKKLNEPSYWLSYFTNASEFMEFVVGCITVIARQEKFGGEVMMLIP